MLLVDVHAHLLSSQFDDDREEVIRRAEERGVKRIIENGLSIESNRGAIELSSGHGSVLASLGLYPVDAVEMGREKAGEVIRLIEENIEKAVAVGEVGLDYHWVKGDKERALEREVFSAVINVAGKHKKPLIVHSRKAEEDSIAMLSKAGVCVVLHSFSGRMSLVERGVALGFFFSVPPNVVRNTQMQALVRNVPLNQLLTETDSPYLSNVSGERNEPSNVYYSVREIARIKGLTEEEAANNIFMNYQRCFGG